MTESRYCTCQFTVANFYHEMNKAIKISIKYEYIKIKITNELFQVKQVEHSQKFITLLLSCDR